MNEDVNELSYKCPTCGAKSGSMTSSGKSVDSPQHGQHMARPWVRDCGIEMETIVCPCGTESSWYDLVEVGCNDAWLESLRAGDYVWHCKYKTCLVREVAISRSLARSQLEQAGGLISLLVVEVVTTAGIEVLRAEARARLAWDGADVDRVISVARAELSPVRDNAIVNNEYIFPFGSEQLHQDAPFPIIADSH